ncbi:MULTISPECIES: helix-turn-helix domain-containing protein [Ramlibacter]|uniref:Helix-turn-helix domain-containing protein n=1 Tax=Ramlibacter pinisoli TaxID=2682844 RepID=A0A6N8IM33_9BURK|nr:MULTISPECIES: helix-turn-helix transcriptional regulator [Ramlibacter]MBA2960540.1 helix-turn-helix domain-containing protein [Ramlibacter sp. CGMCC 1.13660]MVQ27871.1 helix-turn-helix domain-containing protein [Ramlibacter pinisoli]
MPNIASALKEEIARVARKVAKPGSEELRKQVTQQRGALAALKRRIDALERSLASVAKGGRARTRRVADEGGDENQSERHRFSAKGFAKQRERLGISAAAMGQLLGVSSLSVYKWESGKTRPRAKQIEKIASVRGLGKKEAAARLAEGGTISPAAQAGIFADSRQAATSVGSADQLAKEGRMAGKRPSTKTPALKKVSRRKAAPKGASSVKAAAKKTPTKMPAAKKPRPQKAPATKSTTAKRPVRRAAA